MSFKIAEWLQPKLFYRFLTIWIILGGTFYLIAEKHIPVREIVLEGFGMKALLGSGSNDGWKPILSRVVIDSDTPWLEEVGLFLQINQKQNVDGRLARNLGEICLAVRYSRNLWHPGNSFCPPEDFAKVRIAVDTLNDIGFRADSKYVNDKYQSYALNALGSKAFEAIRENWFSKGEEKLIQLALLDLEHPGLRTPLRKAHDWYHKNIDAERAVAQK